LDRRLVGRRVLLLMRVQDRSGRRRSPSKKHCVHRHYSVRELSSVWKVSRRTLTTVFIKEPGVIIFPSVSTNPVEISIPAAIADRVYRRLINRPITQHHAFVPPQRFDVFLAHNSKDKRATEAIARRLKRRGLNPWFDKWNIPPGQLFQEEIERVLRSVAAVAVIVGRSGIGPFELLELRAAISEYAERKIPVIPVLLPGAGIPRLGLLQQFSWVKFRTLRDKSALDDLVRGIWLRRSTSSRRGSTLRVSRG
jgi:hypothetical protein